MKAAGDYKAQFVMLPDLHPAAVLHGHHRRARRSAQHARLHQALQGPDAELAQWNVYLISGSHPTLTDDGRLLNTACYFTRRADPRSRTRSTAPAGREKWNTDAGDQLRLFETLRQDRHPDLLRHRVSGTARMVCEAGADILFVPSSTDDRRGFLRVSATALPCARHREPGLRRHDQHRRQPGRGRAGPALRAGVHHHAVSFPSPATASPPKARPTSSRSSSPMSTSPTSKATA